MASRNVTWRFLGPTTPPAAIGEISWHPELIWYDLRWFEMNESMNLHELRWWNDVRKSKKSPTRSPQVSHPQSLMPVMKDDSSQWIHVRRSKEVKAPWLRTARTVLWSLLMYFALDQWNHRIHSTPRHSVTGPKMTNDIWYTKCSKFTQRKKQSESTSSSLHLIWMPFEFGQASDVVIAVVVSLVASSVMSWATWDCLQGTASCYMLFINSAFCWSLSEILAFDSIRQSTSWQCPGR